MTPLLIPHNGPVVGWGCAAPRTAPPLQPQGSLRDRLRRRPSGPPLTPEPLWHLGQTTRAGCGPPPAQGRGARAHN